MNDTLPIIKHLQLLKKENLELGKRITEMEAKYGRLAEMYESTLKVLKSLQERSKVGK